MAGSSSGSGSGSGGSTGGSVDEQGPNVAAGHAGRSGGSELAGTAAAAAAAVSAAAGSSDSAAQLPASKERGGGSGTAGSAAMQPVNGGDPGSSTRGSSQAAADSLAPQPPAGQQARTDASSATQHHEQRLEEMLSRLQALGWRRVDVCFAGAALPFLAHQHIQYQRVINWPGQTTVKHLALQLAAMEQLRAQRQAMQGQPTAAHGAGGAR